MSGTFRITHLNHRGEGVADGLSVPFSLPGEEVGGEVVGGRIPTPKILSPVTERIKPACRHFRSCGGCSLQHMAAETLHAWKRDSLVRTLEKAAVPAPIRNVHNSPPQSRRRARFTAERTKKSVALGFMAAGSDRLVPLTECPLITPALFDAMEPLRTLIPYACSRKSRALISVTETESGLDVLVEEAQEIDAQTQSELAALMRRNGWARLAWNGEVVAQETPPIIRFDGIAVEPPIGTFLQPSLHGESALIQAVTDAVGSAKTIVDLFAGCGTFALPLAKTSSVKAVEGSASMLQALDAAWRDATGLKPVTTETRDLFRRPLLPLELKKIDAAVIDPPRAGAEAQIRELAASEIPTIAAVSCNPATFARDARHLLDAGFRLSWIDLVDQFLWSPHIELVAQFKRD